jgi:hypothetical protein
MNTLLNKVLQASLKVRMVGTSVSDESLTAELQANHSIADDNVRAVKLLFPGKSGPLGALRRIVGQARKRHIALTFEGFGDSRLLVLAEQQAYRDGLKGLAEKFHYAAAEFIHNYDVHLSAERLHKNGAYDEADYPPADKLPEMFTLETALLPLPEPNQFLKLALGEELQAKYEAQANGAIENIRRETYRMLLNLVAQTAESLAGDGPLVDSETKKGPLAKLREYLDRVPVLNLANDPEIAELHAAAKAKLDVSTEMLRESKMMRQNIAHQAQAIVRRFGVMGNRKIA